MKEGLRCCIEGLLIFRQEGDLSGAPAQVQRHVALAGVVQLVQEVVDSDPAEHPLLQLAGQAHPPVVEAALLESLGDGVQQRLTLVSGKQPEPSSGLECDRSGGPPGLGDPLLRHLEELADGVGSGLGVGGEAAEAGLDLVPELVFKHKVAGEPVKND